MSQIWQDYESQLTKNGKMDFGDMISYALEVAQKNWGKKGAQYSHILIDEFQDITDPQLELIKCLLRNHTDGSNTSLFCVGDDWQNIFSFAGSDIQNIIDFGKHFEYPETTTLSINYRCPPNVVEASTSVARMNSVKVDKEISPSQKVRFPIRLIEGATSYTDSGYEEWEFREAKAKVQELDRIRESAETIMVLARFNRSLRRLRLEFPGHEQRRISFQTIHKAKGTEADYVLLLGCVTGRLGFPSEMSKHRLLDVVDKDRGRWIDPVEEERRLFYVALTRCKKQLFLFTSRNQKSPFIREIEGYLTVGN